ncbi:cilia- and flagella-associated protein 44 [Pelodytes ibericus]
MAAREGQMESAEEPGDREEEHAVDTEDDLNRPDASVEVASEADNRAGATEEAVIPDGHGTPVIKEPPLDGAENTGSSMEAPTAVLPEPASKPRDMGREHETLDTASPRDEEDILRPSSAGAEGEGGEEELSPVGQSADGNGEDMMEPAEPSPTLELKLANPQESSGEEDPQDTGQEDGKTSEANALVEETINGEQMDPVQPENMGAMDVQTAGSPGDSRTLPVDTMEQGEPDSKPETSPEPFPDGDSASVTTEPGQHPESSSPAEQTAEEETQEPEDTIGENFYYEYDNICSQPYVTPDSGIPNNVLRMLHSFGYDCDRRANLRLLDDQTLLYVAGTMTVILSLKPQEQRYLRSSSGGGIGAITVHPSKKYFAVAEKGIKPNIIIYEYPSLKPYRILRGGTEEAYAFVDFNAVGMLLASVGSSPDYMLTLWDWKQEKIILRSKAFSQEVFQVTFSPENEEQLTTCGTGHIKFWEMAHTFTGLKLQGELGRFGKTTLTDIEGYVELPDGKVISGSEWGNMLLWEGSLIKVELCRKGRRPCHSGAINQFVLDEGELITIGVDGYVRVWDFEAVDTADTVDDTGLLEMEPMNELLVGKNVSLQFMVKMAEQDSPVWFAQDANGAIWKLDLSFSNITQDPECLFSFHGGNITALDASPSTHLMASTSLDRSVRIYDFVGRNPIAEMKYKQGGTSLVWAPRMVNPKGGLFAVGFEDGVVRILEVYNPRGLKLVAGRLGAQDAEISLKEAFKPHTAPVTALAYERNGEILATGSNDKTVFFFAVGEKYEPIGFVRVPGPVKELHWSPSSHDQNMLLVLCVNGFVVQIPAPAAQKQDPVITYEIQDLPLQYFRFSSIKSKMEREEEMARRQRVKEEKKKEWDAWIQKQKEKGVELTEEELQPLLEEEEKALPPLYVPAEPSPVLCGFYSSPGKFWLSLDGYDSGFLYLCEFAGSEVTDLSARRDEPLSALPVEHASENPIHKAHFSSNKQLLFCGMQDGTVRVYPLQANDPLLTSMQGYWSLGVHDNQYGRVQAMCCSYDNQYLVTCGADSNIFTFSILSMEDIERDLKAKRAKVPSPRRDLEGEKPAEDIEDPNAYSIETAKQKRQHDLLLKQAEQKKAIKRQELSLLRNEFRLLLLKNTELPAHMQLGRAEFEMDHRIWEEMERQTSERIRSVMKELAWEQEKHSIGLKKLRARFRDNVEFDNLIIHGINCDYQISTYRLLSLSDKYQKVKDGSEKRRPTRYELLLKDTETSKESQDLGKAEQISRDEKETVVPPDRKKPHWAGRPTVGNRLERMKKMIEKTDRVKSKISQRKKEWEEIYKQKPSEDYEDPQDVLAIRNAKENMGDFKLKTAADYTVPEHLRINAAKKRNELTLLESLLHERKLAINLKILSLRDFKVNTIKEIQQLVEEVRLTQSKLDSSKHMPIPPVPSMLPDEMPEEKFEYNSDKLRKFKLEQESKAKIPDALQGGGFRGLGGFGTEKTSFVKETETPFRPLSSYKTRETTCGPQLTQETDMSDLEKEIMQIEEIKSIYKQENLIKKINQLVSNFDAELRLLRHQKVKLDLQMKMGDLRHITLFEELLLLKDFEKREDILQERVSDRICEQEEVKRKSEDCLQQLETKKKDIVTLQEKEKALHSTFQASLGENNKFAVFLTKVFKKKIKRTKKKEVQGKEEDEDESEDESDEESTWESDDDESGSEEGVFDDSVCPDNCDPALFENTLQLREKRLDIEEALTEEKKLVDNLKKEYDSLTKKGKAIEVNLRLAEKELDVFQREKQQKLNELHVVVPLKLHQVDYMVNGEIPSDLSQALIFSHQSLEGLQQRIRELQLEKVEKRELYKQAREQHKHLIRERKEMEAKIQKLEEKCQHQMMMKFGRLVDLESLQTLSVNINLEELKIKSSDREQMMDKELKDWEVKITEAKKGLMDVTREQTRKLERMNNLLTELKALEAKLDARQTIVGAEFQGPQNAENRERQKLLHMVEIQAGEMENLKEEISLLSKKGGSILPPAHPPMPQSSGTLV